MSTYPKTLLSFMRLLKTLGEHLKDPSPLGIQILLAPVPQCFCKKDAWLKTLILSHSLQSLPLTGKTHNKNKIKDSFLSKASKES